MRRLATVHAKAGDHTAAGATLDRMVEHFRARHLPARVLATIQDQADTTRGQTAPGGRSRPRKGHQPG
ncbi:hypothetical protein GCM10022221_30830 [Actinocorallia aurea]